MANKTCDVCGAQIKMLSGKKIYSGMICGSCAGFIPTFVPTEMLSDIDVISWKNYALNKYCEEFEATASYGTLHVDETHGLIAISKKLEKGGKPSERANVISLFDIEDTSLYCKDPKVENDGVFCDVEMSFEISNPHSSVKTRVKQHAKCQSRRTDSRHLSWEEPSDLIMFRSIFSHMIDEINHKLQKDANDISKYDLDLFAARSLFMTDGEMTDDELKDVATKLMFAFRDDPDRTLKIKSAYLILKNHFKRLNRGDSQ